MTNALPFDGRMFIADTSAWWQADHPDARDEWNAAVLDDRISTCAPVRFELLFSARDGDDYDRLAAHLATLHDVPITRGVVHAALGALGRLAHARPPLHRVARFPDILIAAAAEHGAVGVLHYDRHFDRLAEVLSFESRWIAPPGSL